MDHQLTISRETTTGPDDGGSWAVRQPTGDGTCTCTCGRNHHGPFPEVATTHSAHLSEITGQGTLTR